LFSHFRFGAGLSFFLRFYHELAEPDDTEPTTPKDRLVEMVQYTPLELDKESPAFIDRLDFLGDSFTFARTQLPLFFSTLQRNMASVSRDDNGGDGNGSEMETENV
jgi:hypothetical protein